MTFLNETLHPQALPLLGAILKGSELDIEPLKEWRREYGLNSKQAERLYGLISDAFDDKSPDSIPMGTAASKMSRALWEAGV